MATLRKPWRLDQQRLQRVNGSNLEGTILSFDAQQRQFKIDCGEGRIETIDEDQLQDIVLAAPSADESDDLWCVSDRDGLQLSGKLVKVEHDSLFLECPGIREPISLPIANLKAMIPLRPLTKSADKNANKPVDKRGPVPAGRLEMTGIVVARSLTTPAAESPTCLAWQPAWSKVGAAFMAGVNGRIVYHDPPPPPPTANPQVRNVRAPCAVPAAPPRGGLLSGILSLSATANSSESASKYPSVLHLRSGDNIRCKVTKIDEHGVTMTTASATPPSSPNQQLMAIELIVDADAKVISKTKQERLLMTPRMQRLIPPTI